MGRRNFGRPLRCFLKSAEVTVEKENSGDLGRKSCEKSAQGAEIAVLRGSQGELRRSCKGLPEKRRDVVDFIGAKGDCTPHPGCFGK